MQVGGSRVLLRSQTVRVLRSPHRNNASARRRSAAILRRMVTFRRETRLWRATAVTQRALMIRDDADTYWLACQMQHGRITCSDPTILSDPRSVMIQRRIGVDLFIVSLNRLHTVADLARADDPVLRAAGPLDGHPLSRLPVLLQHAATDVKHLALAGS